MDISHATQCLRVLVIGEDAMISPMLQVQADAHFAQARHQVDIDQYHRIPDALKQAFRKEYNVIVLAPTLKGTDLDMQNSLGESLLRDIRAGRFGEPATSTPVVLVCGISEISEDSFHHDPLTTIVDTVHPHESKAPPAVVGHRQRPAH